MNPVIQAQVSEFSENFSLQARSTSDQFEVYSIYAILNGALGESIDPTDAHLIGAEFGLDGVAILVQGRLVVDSETACEALDDVINPKIDFYFFQSKTSTSYDYGDASKFFDSIKGFFNDGMKGESVQLDDLIAAKEVLYKNGVHRRNPGIHAYYITTGNYDHPPRIESLIEATKLQLSDTNIFENTDISIEMIGAKNLQRHYRAASSSVEVTIEFPRNAVMPAHNLVNEAYIGYIKAEELIKIVSIKDESGKPTEINKSVFFDNIRDFDPDSDINLEISRTLANGEASDFVFRNNGITVVSKIIKRIGDNFKIEDYQVVNGCQTSNIIFHNRDHTNEAHIPIRIIGTNNDEFI